METKVVSKNEEMIRIADSYFRKLDTGAQDLFDLFVDDVEVFFPKFGVAKGKTGFLQLAMGFGKFVKSIKHHYDDFNFIVSGDTIVVEGTSEGELLDGTKWKGGKTAGGRFCNVFEIKDGKITRMNIYLDPDYGAADSSRLYWGTELSEVRSW